MANANLNCVRSFINKSVVQNIVLNVHTSNMQAFVQFTWNENTNFNHVAIMWSWVIAINNKLLPNDIISRQGLIYRWGAVGWKYVPKHARASISSLFIVIVRAFSLDNALLIAISSNRCCQMTSYHPCKYDSSLFTVISVAKWRHV